MHVDFLYELRNNTLNQYCIKSDIVFEILKYLNYTITCHMLYILYESTL